MPQICVGCGLGQDEDGFLGVKLRPTCSECDIHIECDTTGLCVVHTLNRMVLRKSDDQEVSAPDGLAAEQPYSVPVTWDAAAVQNDGTGLTKVGDTIRVDTEGLYIICMNFRVRALPITAGIGEHMVNFNIVVNGARRAGSIIPYSAPFSHRQNACMTSNIPAGAIVSVEFGDQPITGIIAQDWQLQGDTRNEFSVVRLQQNCGGDE